MSVKNMINLYSLNVNGLQNREKRGRAIEWVKSMKCDIAYFQETHFDQNIARRVFGHLEPGRTLRTGSDK